MKKKKSTLLIVSMSFLLSIGTLIFSSCADKDDPSPILPTPEDTPYILKLKFSEKVPPSTEGVISHIFETCFDDLLQLLHNVILSLIKK